MTANLNAVLGLTLQVVDNAATTTPINSQNQGITLGATVVAYDRYFQVGTSATVFNLPGATVWFLYVRNMGTNVVTLSYTPTGGTSQSVQLCPVTNGYGGVFLVFNTVETSNGITAVSLIATGGTTPCEIAAGF
jgi:hypothetical protein